MKQVIVGVTGASGTIYADRLIRCLLEAGCGVHLVVTDAGRQVAAYEMDWQLTGEKTADGAWLQKHFASDQVTLYGNGEIGSRLASGSARMEAMVVIPASMGAVSGIACGRSQNLLERSADVILKERRPLILMPRETPLSTIHLENLLKLSRMGVDIIPAMPAFYNRPESIMEMVDFLVGRVLDHLNIDMDLYRRWEGN